MGWYRYGRFAPYVSVAERKKKAASKIAALKKKGQVVHPVVLEGKTITKTFWGKAWCENLESYSDFENRLPRGRTYVRNGSVIDLQVNRGEIKALVNGSSIYKVKVSISAISNKKWGVIVKECAGKIDSLIELLQGNFSKGVMEIITHREKGLFPHPKEIKLQCSCPDYADMCKHVAAVMYGVGARLDERPEELFLLRQADHTELTAKASTVSLSKVPLTQETQLLDNRDLSTLFGIEIEEMTQQLPEKQHSIKKKSSNNKLKKTKTNKASLKQIVKSTSKTSKSVKNTSVDKKKSASPKSQRNKRGAQMKNKKINEAALPKTNVRKVTKNSKKVNKVEKLKVSGKATKKPKVKR